jgi:hypothetical protein
MKKLFLFITYVLAGLLTSAQYFQTGQDPASIRWRQINTRNFQIIYPDYYEAQAQKLASNLDAVYVYGSYTLKHNPAKIPVILHTQTVQSNGLVAWAPKRAEFYTTPHQSMYPQDWLEQLALHEFRHVVQIDKIHQNLPAWARFLFGEQGTALAFGAYLPFWWIEGDAVVAETALSNQGRGRQPSFLMEHRAQVLEKGIFSYEKAFFRSYRDFVPNHYKLGYYLTGSIRARHGTEIWEEVLTRAGRKPLSIFPMRQVLKERTGLNIVQNYHSVFDSLKTVWEKEDMEFEQETFSLLSDDHRFFTSYNHNYWLNDSTLLSYKTAFDEIPSFVRREKNRREEKILFPGYIFNESVNYRDEWVVWSEQIKDLRWEHSGRSLLRLANVNTNRRIEIKPEFKAFSPAVSPDKLKIAVVETDFSSNYYLSVYQLPDGKLLHRYQTPDNNYFFMPEWLNNTEAAAIILSHSGKRLVKVNFNSNEMEFLSDFEFGDIKHLRASNDYIYFISSYSGKNSLYRLNMEDSSVEMVYEPRFGVESPAVSPDGKRIALSDYHSEGFRLIEISAENSRVRTLNEVKRGSYPLAETLTLQESGFPVFSDTVASDYYSSKKYRKAAHLFNFHSWGPVYPDIVNYEFYPGISFMSQNVLGTSETVLGYKYDLTENTGKFMADYSFKGWYPMFDLKLSHGPRASEYNLIEQITDSQGRVIRQDTTSQRFTWGETTTGLNIRLPLQYGKGPFSRIFQPEVQYRFNYYSHHESTPERFHSGSFHSLGYRFYIHQMLRRSYLDMFPDFGIALDGTFRHSPAGDIRAGQLKALQTVVYLPGMMKNHGIKLYAGAQEKKANGTMGFSDVVRYARGWGRINTTAIYTGAADYNMPLLYPDWNFWGLLYTRRIQTSLFTDYTRLKGNFYHAGHVTGTFTKDISSMGAELTADVNIIRFYAPSTIGFRASYLPEMKNVYFDFLFSINFTSF